MRFVEDDIYKSTSRLLLGHVKAEYDELGETWRDIERKAQTNIAVAGIFLTGTSVVFRMVGDPSWIMKLLFFLAFVLLALTALLSLRALLVADYESLEDSADVLVAAQKIFASPDNDSAKTAIREFVLERVTKLKEANEHNHKVNNRKAEKVARAQQVLIAGVTLVVVAIVGAVFSA